MSKPINSQTPEDHYSLRSLENNNHESNDQNKKKTSNMTTQNDITNQQQQLSANNYTMNNYQKLLNLNSKLQNDIQEYEEKVKVEFDKIHVHKTIIKELKKDIKELQDEKNSFEIKYMKLKQKYTDQYSTLQELKQRNEYFEVHCNELVQNFRSLKQKNNELEVEASNYQSALGVAANFDLSDDGRNHNVKLNEDILALHDTLENYVTNLKPNIDVNINEVKQLLIQYGCQTKISDKEPNKPLIKAVLQRHVLEEIFDQTNYYFTLSNKEHHLESDIVSQATILSNLMENFHNNRLGDDEITRFAPIRIRQQVFTALGTRGFNDIKKSGKEISLHDFIYTISKRINNMMNKYRIINNIEKKKYTKALSKDLVRDVVRIFYFRLRIQEPIVQFRWIQNSEEINKSYMIGSWDEDNVENMVVDICSFPLILKPSHPGGFKVYTPAKVFPRHVTKPSLTDKFIGMFVGRKLKNTMYESNEQTRFTDEYDIEQISSDESKYYSPTETIIEEL